MDNLKLKCEIKVLNLRIENNKLKEQISTLEAENFKLKNDLYSDADSDSDSDCNSMVVAEYIYEISELKEEIEEYKSKELEYIKKMNNFKESVSNFIQQISINNI